MMSTLPVVKLKDVVRFREYLFGLPTDPSMREAMAPEPWPHQDDLLRYLRSGYVIAVVMGGGMRDGFDRGQSTCPMINGRLVDGMTSMTDGVWVWCAGLIYFIEKYNVRVDPEFVAHARSKGWAVDHSEIGPYQYDFFPYD